eukprot:TRINITY_DN5526_c2_g1_i1.p1 TRINITY_DN5526_c2_g1~~TRINITY_DN5526_c2_g1_i1.p1  ORF type:complete len:552 (+),score=96.74 TRINITY_DN5526_c2_g1_i1:153-1808(+)
MPRVMKLLAKTGDAENEAVKTDDVSSAAVQLPSGAARAGATIVYVAIVANALQLGLSSMYPEEEMLWFALDNVFTLIFFVEMLVKLRGQGLMYFKSKWNSFDFLLACLAVLDTWIFEALRMTGSLSTEAGVNVTVARLCRLVRILRIARFAEKHPELYVLLEGMLGSLSAMFWIVLFLSIMIYSGAIFCVQMIDHRPYFGNFGESLFTMLNLSLMLQWNEIVRPLAMEMPYMLLFFVPYSLVCTFTLMNLIIGVITNQTMEASRELHAERAARQKNVKMKNLSALIQAIFHGDDALTVDELHAAADLIPGLGKALHELGLPMGFDLSDIHLMFDAEYTGTLSRDELHEGMFRLIFNNDFQRDCGFQLMMQEIKREIHLSHDSLMKEINDLRADMCLTSVAQTERLGDSSQSLRDRKSSVMPHADEITPSTPISKVMPPPPPPSPPFRGMELKAALQSLEALLQKTMHFDANATSAREDSHAAVASRSSLEGDGEVQPAGQVVNLVQDSDAFPVPPSARLVSEDVQPTGGHSGSRRSSPQQEDTRRLIHLHL